MHFVIRKATSQATQCIRSSDNNGKTDVFDYTHSLVHTTCGGRLSTFLANGIHTPGKKLPIFRCDDGVNRSAKDLNSEGLELIFQLDTHLQSRLTTKSNINGVRSFVHDYFAHKISCYRQEVYLVGETFGGLNCRNVGVDENGVDAFFLQSFDSLTTGIVELSSLTNAQTSTTEDKYLLDVHSRVQFLVLFVLRIARARCALRMKLHTEVGLADVHNTLVATVVGVHKQLFPFVFRKSWGADGETVILRSNVTLARNHARARDVVPTVTELHLFGTGSSSLGEQLVAKTNSEHWCTIKL
ncbi:hypothetical protein RRF57_000017 [Xylaria bambusicola]|uniref:Uncharacterized protein n=1 Tax=Xylaria bambusicola TaxID=326684 RepID=A0AAN7UEU8_9PEZI